MISRTLVPRDVKPAKPDDLKRHGSRVTTYMDDRMVVPAGPSDAPPLDGKTNIPAHMPLGVLVETMLVPRGMPVKPIERSVQTQEQGAMALEVLDSRLVVPAHVNVMEPEEREEFAPIDAEKFRDVIEPDIFLTGDANLLIEPEEKRDANWELIRLVISIGAHVVLILFLVFAGRIIKPTAPLITQEDKDLGLLYLPPPPTVRPPTPKLPKIDPRLLTPPPVERLALPEPVQPPPPPQPVKPPPDLPEAPTPRNVLPTPSTPQPPQVAQNTPPPSQLEPIKPQPKGHLDLNLSDKSPGQTLQDQLQDAIKRQPAGSYSTQGSLTPNPGGGARAGIGNGVTALTPEYGVDFNSYIQRMLETIDRNWRAVMPESALLGDTGAVLITFQINPDGSVQMPDPIMERTSGKVPLDSAAMSAIKASNPFEPLPKEFIERAPNGAGMRFGILFEYCGFQACPTH